MPSMKGMGPACCCCNNLYVGLDSGGAEAMRRHDTVGNQPGDPAVFWDFDYFARGASLDFDPVHKRVFVARGTSPTDDNSVFRYDDKFANQLLLTALGSEWPAAVTSDSDNELVYFSSIDQPVITGASLHVVAHDGTGYAFIGALTNSGLHPRVKIHYCRANAKLYYIGSTLPEQQLWRIETDGTGDTLIATGATALSNIRDCTVDNDNSLLYWCDNANGGQTSRIYRSDLDGGNVTLLLSGVVNTGAMFEHFYGVQWSHKKQRLYFWSHDIMSSASGDTTHGWSSMTSNGADVQLHIARGNGFDWWSLGSNVPFDWRLGCGYETLGAGSTA